MKLEQSRVGIFMKLFPAITILVVPAMFFPPSLRAQMSDVEQIDREVRKLCVNLPFSMPSIPVPAFPDRRVSITEHGAIADGRTLNTKAIADAIQSCAQAGGGSVVVPPGTWLTGPIRLESNINLHLERGALVQFSSRIEDFPLIAGFDGKSKKFIVTPPISAFRSKNIAITGEGVIDGAGEVWRYVKKEKLTERQWKDLVASGGAVSADGREWWPSKEAMNGEKYIKAIEESGKRPTAAEYALAREYLRPDLVQLVQCEGVLLDGPTFQNSPRYQVRPTQSENIIVRNVKVYAPWYGQNTDGIDVVTCRNVVVYNSTVDVGDDGICLKPGSISSRQTSGPACENIVVANCVVYHAHGGFVIGSESFGGARNVSVCNCVFVGTDVGIRFKSGRGRGGVVEDVYIEGIQMRAIENEAILFDMYYGGGAPDVESLKSRSSRQAEAVTRTTPQFQNISISNVVCSGAQQAILVNGLPEMPVRNITFEKINISAKKGVTLIDADSVRLRACSILPQAGPVMTMIQSRNVTVEGGTFPDWAKVFLSVRGEGSGNIRLVGINLPDGKNAIRFGQGVHPDAVIWDRGR